MPHIEEYIIQSLNASYGLKDTTLKRSHIKVAAAPKAR